MQHPSNDPGWIEYYHRRCPYWLNQNCQFWRFTLLPKEVQLVIWEHAANEQSSHCRGLIILPKSTSDPDSIDEPLRAEYKIPELLHTCSDARKVALTRYRLAFRGQLIHPAYFNFNKDHLYFRHIEDVWMFYVDSRRGYRDLKRVKHILFTSDRMDDHCVLSICERFPALKFLGFIERTPPVGSPPARPSRLFLPSEAVTRFRRIVPHIIEGVHKREPNFGTWHAPTIFWGTFGQMAITIQNMQEEVENRMDWESTETVYLEPSCSLERNRQVLGFEGASHRDVVNMQNWVSGNGCIAWEEKAYLKRRVAELFSVVSPNDNAVTWLGAFLEDSHIYFRERFGQFRNPCLTFLLDAKYGTALSA